MRTSSAIFLACCAIIASAACAQTSPTAPGFKFSNPSPDEKTQADAEAGRRITIDALLSTPCAQKVKNRKIMVLLGEERNGAIVAAQGSYGRHVDAINSRLKM